MCLTSLHSSSLISTLGERILLEPDVRTKYALQIQQFMVFGTLISLVVFGPGGPKSFQMNSIFTYNLQGT